MLPIQEKYIKYNFTANGRPSIEYIVIHDTGNFKSGANAQNHFDYFNSGNVNASADYFVDDSNIIKTVHDQDRSWHCGDGRGIYGIANSNSIGIEMCVNADGDYTKTVANTVELVKFLMQKYNVPIEKVVRHYDASRKNCPQTMNNNGDWSKWDEFKKRVSTPDHWAQPYYNNLINMGMKLDVFEPDKEITKGELYAMLDKFRIALGK